MHAPTEEDEKRVRVSGESLALSAIKVAWPMGYRS
jgi:hypothetical protein